MFVPPSTFRHLVNFSEKGPEYPRSQLELSIRDYSNNCVFWVNELWLYIDRLHIFRWIMFVLEYCGAQKMTRKQDYLRGCIE